MSPQVVDLSCRLECPAQANFRLQNFGIRSCNLALSSKLSDPSVRRVPADRGRSIGSNCALIRSLRPALKLRRLTDTGNFTNGFEQIGHKSAAITQLGRSGAWIKVCSKGSRFAARRARSINPKTPSQKIALKLLETYKHR